MEFTFVKDYRDDAVLRESFFSLARGVFGIRFDGWFEMGYWTDKYIPYSYCVGDKVIANVSVSRISLVIEGAMKRGFQIGTLMVHPDFRGRGLSCKLMEIVLAEYEGKYDLLYLFANDSVLDFYPKFGFARKKEHHFSVSYSGKKGSEGLARKLDMDDERDRQLLYKHAKRRCPVSGTFAATGTEELLMFYCLNVFKDCIYFFEDEECIAIYEEEEGELQLYDFISNSPLNLPSMLVKIAGQNTNRVVFHFTPEECGLPIASSTYSGSDTLFVRTAEGITLPERFKHPITSQA